MSTFSVQRYDKISNPQAFFAKIYQKPLYWLKDETFFAVKQTTDPTLAESVA